MIKGAARAVTVATILMIAVQPSVSQDTGPDASELDALLEAVPAGDEYLDFGRTIDHYDDLGYPEDSSGTLVLVNAEEGPMIFIEGEEIPYLLYAQYKNLQRDAVILARTGRHVDVLPTGEEYVVPFGYGTLRRNEIAVSIIESRITPHFSDNQKMYTDFPLVDWYIGGSFGLTGIETTARYVRRETLAAHIALGINAVGGIGLGSVLNQYRVPFHFGVGYRFPGPFPDLIGDTLLTAGADMLLGFGDGDLDAATPSFIGLPGVFLDVERVLTDGVGLARDYRADPRPYNYRVNAVALRTAVYLAFAQAGSGGLLVPSIALSYSYNIIGPRIPSHEFKETEVVYLNDIYREDLKRQQERRQSRTDG